MSARVIPATLILITLCLSPLAATAEPLPAPSLEEPGAPAPSLPRPLFTGCSATCNPGLTCTPCGGPAEPQPLLVGRLGDAELGLTANPAFRTAARMRNAGIVIFSVGLSAAAFAGVGASVELNAERATCGWVALGSAIGSLGIGLPLWLGGQSRMNTMRREQRLQLVPVISGFGGPQGGQLGARWTF